MWWAWIPKHQHEIYAYLREHMLLTALSVAFGFVIALPLAVFAARRRAVAAVVVPVGQRGLHDPVGGAARAAVADHRYRAVSPR